MNRRNTRELILQTSLQLFNELGEPNVTTNQIADEAEISPGNLYYHFRSKNDIVIELFKRFLVRFQPLLEAPHERQTSDAEELWFLMHLIFELKGEFRFIYLHITDLTAKVPHLDHAMRGLLRREHHAAQALLDDLQRQGVLMIEAREKRILADNIHLAMTYWLPYSMMFDPGGLENGHAQVDSMARVMQMILPYLTEGARKQYARLLDAYMLRN